MTPLPSLHPTLGSERIISLDVLRGVAVLGILAMNIQAFAMIDAAYQNPTAFGDLSGINWWVWYITRLVADTKFMTIFSLLFGAGIAMMAERTLKKGGQPTGLHYRRMAWLLVIGLIHAYIFWYGDILVAYAICGMCIYPLRRLRSRVLIPIGVAMIAIPSLIMFVFSATIPYWPVENLAAMRSEGLPDATTVRSQLEMYRGGWAGQMGHRATTVVLFQTFGLIIFTFWRVGGTMVLGMALRRLGILQARRSLLFYAVMVVGGCVIGLPLIDAGVAAAIDQKWDPPWMLFTGMQFNYWGGLFVAASWIGAVMFICKAGIPILKPVVSALGATGRMAFTNYLAQTVICCFIFYGYGLGFFGHLQRWEQLMVVLGIWVIQLIWSPLWLRFFRYGPMEWAWRSLVLWTRQPMRRST